MGCIDSGKLIGCGDVMLIKYWSFKIDVDDCICSDEVMHLVVVLPLPESTHPWGQEYR
jgi:hypothetical protein